MLYVKLQSTKLDPAMSFLNWRHAPIFRRIKRIDPALSGFYEEYLMPTGFISAPRLKYFAFEEDAPSTPLIEKSV